MTDEKDRSAIVIPFGKHKGSTVAELLVRDPSYAEWIIAQGWVAERFAELHAAILSRGASTDDSPEHNAIQVRFLDETFRLAFLRARSPKAIAEDRQRCRDQFISYLEKEARAAPARSRWEEEGWLPKALSDNETKLARIRADKLPISSSVQFEQMGIDVIIRWHVCVDNEPSSYGGKNTIEIKPTVGDDFPSVMRQMERLQCGTLVLGEYTGRAVSAPQLRQMFEANGKRLIFVRDIEAEFANARAELE